MRGPTGVKFCTMVSTRPYFIMPLQNFGGHTPKKISGAKNMQNLARFRMTSKFGGEYLRNGWIYSKSDFYSVYRDSSCVRRNKSGEVWFSDLGDLDVESYPPKVHFSEDHISAPRGCCASKFLHALDNEQVLLAHPPTGTGAPLQFFSNFFGTWRVSMFGCWSQISLESMKITTKSKRRWRERSFRRWTKKNCEIPSTTNQVISANVDLP